MKEKEKENNKKSSLFEFQRYIRGEMTKKEENAFQRKLYNDPFAEEAIESFSEISPQEADDDIEPSGKQFIKRIKSGKRIIIYTSAALVAVLIIISSVFIILDRNKPALQTSKNIIKPAPLEVTDSNQITELLLAESNNATDTTVIEAEQEITNDITDTASTAIIENPAIAENTEALAMTGGKDSNIYIAKDQISVPVTVLKEVVFAIDDSAKKAENMQTGYISPQPVAGSSNFNKYIEENIIRPLVQPQGEEAVAVVSFVVRTTGIIDSIKVISSPGNEFAREAIRLIREGPAWKPAEDNGRIIDDEVRVRIVWKKQ